MNWVYPYPYPGMAIWAPGFYGKRQAVGLPFAVVGVLPQDDDLNLVQGGVGEGIEELVPRGKNMFAGFFFCAKEGL